MTCVARRRTVLGVALAACLLPATAGCGRSAEGEEVTTLAPPPAAAGHPPGTVTLPSASDVPAGVKKLQDAITAGGGTVLATVDNTADADLLGITIPRQHRGDRRARPRSACRCCAPTSRRPPRCPTATCVQQDATGAVRLVYNGPDYVRGRRGASTPAVTSPFAQASRKVADAAATASGNHQSAPLVGVSPTGFLRVAAEQRDGARHGHATAQSRSRRPGRRW